MRLPALLIASLLSLRAVHAAAQPSAAPTSISAAEYAARRDSLLARLGDGAAVVAFGERAPIGFPAFYQVPTFRYLTGFLEPEAALLLARRGGATTAILFREPRSARDVIMDGQPEDSAALAARTGLALRPLAALSAVVDSVLGAGATIHTLRDVRPYGGTVDSLTRGASFAATLRRRTPAPTLRSADAQLDALRARKSDAERAMLRRAAEVTSASLRETIARMRPGMREYEIQASIESGFRTRGADRPGFATNVSAGANATIVHHRAADDVAEAGALVLMDVGAAWQGYTADITRTVPVSGRFTPAQRAIYQLVRDAQAAAETAGETRREHARDERHGARRDRARAGEARDHRGRGRELRPALGRLVHGVTRRLPAERALLLARAGARHRTRGARPGPRARTRGPDARRRRRVHDRARGVREQNAAGSSARHAAQPRFRRACRDAVSRYHGIGVRIEDDFLVTSRGVERISTTPREVEEIERLMRRTPR